MRESTPIQRYRRDVSIETGIAGFDTGPGSLCAGRLEFVTALLSSRPSSWSSKAAAAYHCALVVAL